MAKYAGVTNDIMTQAVVQTFLANSADGESADDLTKLAVKDQSGAGSYATQILIAETLTADRVLTLDLNNADRTIDLTGNLTLSGNLTTTGAYNLTLALGATVTLTLPATNDVLVGRDTTDTLTAKTLTAPDINGGTVDSVTSLSIRSTGAAYDLKFATAVVFGANRTLTITIPDANTALTLTGDLIRSGAHSLTLTTTGTTDVTLPTSGTLITNAVTTLSSLVSIGTIATGTWNASVITVPYGGTGLATLTDHGVVLGSGTGAVSVTSAGTAGQPLMSGGSGADPDWGTLGVNYGGTGATTLTDHGILLGSGTGAITPLGSATNGQLPIGSTGADPVLATITATANETTVANGAGTITIGIADDVVIPTSITIPNTGLHILDTNASHDMIVACGTDISADRTLTISIPDAAVALTLTGDFIRSGAHSLTLTTTNTTDVTLPTTGTLATLDGTETLTAKTLTAPDINGGTVDSVTSLSIRSTGAAYDLSFATAVVFGANRALNITIPDADTALTLTGDFIRSGAHSLTLTTTNTTDVTLPTTGTLATLDGVETLTQKSLTSAVNTGDTEIGLINLTDDTELTIAAGVITATQSWHTVDTAADGATDDLDTINGGTEGDLLIISPNNAARTVVAKHGTGNLNLASGADFTMDEDDDFLMLLYDGTNWQELSRSENHA
uniref:Uncharacterized protein n=2 Tax=viral metagenome TaxID=1070528 RepID=A0A6M3KV48_9ZZZZ